MEQVREWVGPPFGLYERSTVLLVLIEAVLAVFIYFRVHSKFKRLSITSSQFLSLSFSIFQRISYAQLWSLISEQT